MNDLWLIFEVLVESWIEAITEYDDFWGKSSMVEASGRSKNTERGKSHPQRVPLDFLLLFLMASLFSHDSSHSKWQVINAMLLSMLSSSRNFSSSSRLCNWKPISSAGLILRLFLGQEPGRSLQSSILVLVPIQTWSRSPRQSRVSVPASYFGSNPNYRCTLSRHHPETKTTSSHGHTARRQSVQ